MWHIATSAGAPCMEASNLVAAVLSSNHILMDIYCRSSHFSILFTAEQRLLGPQNI